MRRLLDGEMVWERTIEKRSRLPFQSTLCELTKHLADFDGRAFVAARWTEVVGRSFDRNRAKILRELQVDERRFAVACDECVIGHIRFPRRAWKIHV